MSQEFSQAQLLLNFIGAVKLPLSMPPTTPRRRPGNRLMIFAFPRLIGRTVAIRQEIRRVYRGG